MSSPPTIPGEPEGRCGRYLLLDKIGAGGMGIVYAAYDPSLDRKIALKVLRPNATAASGSEAGDETTDAGDARARLVREAKALARLSHPNVVHVYEVGTVGAEVYVAMELIDGVTLRQFCFEKRRTIPELLPIFIQAAQGLAAAHAAGLVHRDFKPDNVLCGHDGRVVVLDFGLAVPPGDARGAVTGAGESSGSHTAMAGTPAYMAPEQQAGLPTDARTDQFSFCVALYEALNRRRPFKTSPVQIDPDGNTVTEAPGLPTKRLKPPEPTPEVLTSPEVPRWLHLAVMRGLSARPDDRYPSMDALIHELRRDPATLRRRIGAGITAALIVAGGVALAASARRDEPTVCRGAESRLSGVWDATQRARVEASFAATQLPYAADTASRATRALDDYARAWSAMRTSACEATHVRGEQSADLLDLRMECLDCRLQAVKAQVDVFTTADETVVQKAVGAVLELPAIADCADAAALRAPQRLPADPATRMHITEVRQELATANALTRSGKYAPALTEAQHAAATADTIAFAPLRTEALFALADLQEKNGDYHATLDTLHQAARAAEVAHDDIFGARILGEMVFVVGTREAKLEEARGLAADAQAKIDRAGTADPLVIFGLQRAVGAAAFSAGKWEDAITAFRTAIAAAERLPGGDAKLSLALMSLAAAQINNGDLDEGVANHRRAVALIEKTLGPEHPYLGYATLNLGYALHREDKEDEAQAMLERCLQIQKQLAADHIVTAMAHGYLGDVLRARGHLDEALVELQTGLAMAERTVGADHPHIREILLSLGLLYEDRGEPAKAVAPLERSIALYEKNGGDLHDADQNRFTLARVLWASGGDHARAVGLARQALANLTGSDYASLELWLATHPE